MEKYAIPIFRHKIILHKFKFSKLKKLIFGIIFNKKKKDYKGPPIKVGTFRNLLKVLN